MWKPDLELPREGYGRSVCLSVCLFFQLIGSLHLIGGTLTMTLEPDFVSASECCLII